MDNQVIIAVIVVIVLFLLAGMISALLGGVRVESPEKSAGRLGERIAGRVIREILDPEDILLTNVKISAERKQTELDNVVINSDGVFIIEVKNYSGILIGEEDDFEWIKNKTTYAGNFYQKTVKNPIGQMKRQIYILSKYLKERHIDVWIEGYVFLIERNSPVDSPYILKTQKDIDTALHTGSNILSEEDVEKIKHALTGFS